MSGDLIPVGGARFFTPFQIGLGVVHPPPTTSLEVKERVEEYLCCTSGPSWHVKV